MNFRAVRIAWIVEHSGSTNCYPHAKNPQRDGRGLSAFWGRAGEASTVRL